MVRLYKRVLAAVLCLALIAAIMPAAVFAEEGQPSTPESIQNDFVPGQVIVGLKEPFTGNLIELLPEISILDYKDMILSTIYLSGKRIEEVNKTMRDAIGTTFDITLLEETCEAVEKAVTVLENNPYIDYITPNYYCIGIPDTIPNDPYYAPETGTQQWGLQRIGAPEAWDYITGSNATDGSELDDYVKVAVIDGGIDCQHIDLVNNIDTSLAYNAYTDTIGDTSYDTPHGTHVAGIIGAEGNNNTGVVGVCWNVSIVPVKISYNSAGSTSVEAMINAFDYVSTNDILISNLSYFVQNNSGIIAAVQRYSDSGGLLIKSAGNADANIENSYLYAGCRALSEISGVIVVGALKNDSTGDFRAYFSNYGVDSVDLFAPGQLIMSTIPNNDYDTMDGTSMAAPFVTGTAALIKSANTGYINTTIKKRILDNVTTSSNLTNYCVTGGRLNIPDALYDMGYRVIISNTMTHGTVRPSAIFTKPNTIVYLTAYPDAGYMLKPGTMKHNSNNTYQISKWRCFCAMPYMDDTITAQFYMVGDVDFDEAITVADSLAALRHYAGTGVLTGDAFLAADVDGDGDVDYDDAQTIQAFAAHMIDHFPIEE